MLEWNFEITYMKEAAKTTQQATDSSVIHVVPSGNFLQISVRVAGSYE